MRWKSEYSRYRTVQEDTTAILTNSPYERDAVARQRDVDYNKERRLTPPSPRFSPTYRDSFEKHERVTHSEADAKPSRNNSMSTKWTLPEVSRRSCVSPTRSPTENETTDISGDSLTKELNHRAMNYERFRRSLLKHIDEDLTNQQVFGGMLLNPGNYPMIDLRYAYALAGARQFQVPQVPSMLLGYPNAALVNPNVEAAYASYLERARHLVSSSDQSSQSPYKHNPHQRYTLNDRWSKEKEMTSFNYSSSPMIHDDRDADSDPNHSDRGSDHPPSPSSSTSSMTSPSSPQKTTVHLPAYLRSRLNGVVNASEVDGSNGKPKKCRRSRTVFTELQMLGLEKRFEKQQYLSTPDRVELAELLGLSQLQVKTWYQNRRMKWKKQVLQGGGTEPPTKPKGRPRKIRPEEQSSHNVKPPATNFTNGGAVMQSESKVKVSC
uniref:Uncharacterized protein LOC778551 n=1 Tax=Phallusia mammillata TaxID=59560 RepID=A0A6F9DK49_9ASCI|nr:uncharacterized protein LOC778551 [Phallusia mammillata]